MVSVLILPVVLLLSLYRMDTLLGGAQVEPPGAWGRQLAEFDPPGIVIRARIDLVLVI